MKFKAYLTENGVNLLEKRFIQSLDKIAKICHLYLTKDHFIFLHNLLNGDGIHSVAQFHTDLLFHDYRISSQNLDRIAFAVDLSLLHRALRSASAVAGGGGDRLQIKLVKKLPVSSTIPSPFLSFETKGIRSAVVQDVPISKPMSRSQIEELQAALDSAQELPPRLVQVQDLNQLQSFVERMKSVGDLLEVTISRRGDLRLRIATAAVTLGAEFRRLPVVGERSDAAEGAEEETVQVSVKHFAKSLCYHLAKPDCAFYGIGPRGGSLTVIFQFFVPGSQVLDKSISLHCRLPVLDNGES